VTKMYHAAEPEQDVDDLIFDEEDGKPSER
jgi:hypothetical protein